MSSSEGKNFGMNDISDSESDDYRPAPKKTTKPKTTKVAAAPKTKAATTKTTGKSKVAVKKVLVDHNDNADEAPDPVRALQKDPICVVDCFAKAGDRPLLTCSGSSGVLLA
ncbi:hypothetical protein GYMLUDRAFT_253030 [Collybiopsis luxurians FD-317 M1]|uniref:Uncharacterized protein n=1 Tax=Collybiopsis luxurians FD-317 M1 TaxID=944289 RepID=A0A0D0AJL8_9AGAR|nr:hypothetical protein GYMLUDRAFT_253030 [Collybiopsis luxurians FD-317 M1]